MAYLTNAELWNAVRNSDSSFAAITPEASADIFTERGFEALANKNPHILGQFYALSLKIFMQEVRFAEVRDLLEDQGFGEKYGMDLGSAIVQRVYQGIMPCINPGYLNLENGDSPDQYVVRKGDPVEEFWQMNENLANLITVPDNFQYKGLFTQPYGMSLFVSGQTKSIVEGFKLQRYDDKKEAINAAINSKDHPLLETQKYSADDITDAQSTINFIELLRNIVDAMVVSPTGAGGRFNAGEFASKINEGDLKFLARPALFNKIAKISRLESPENLAIPIPIVKVEDFGGTYPVLKASRRYAAGKVKVSNTAVPSFTEYENTAFTSDEAVINADVSGATETKIFNKLGVRVATAYYLENVVDVKGTKYTTVYIPVKNADIYDPNEDILGVIADKGLVFYNEINPVMIEPARNAFGRYTNMHLTSPDNGIAVDHRKTLVVIRKNG